MTRSAGAGRLLLCTAALALGSVIGEACSAPRSESMGADTADSGACLLLAANFDNACITDGDCVGVPPGGNICNPCSEGSGNAEGALFCPFSALSRSGAAAFHARLDTAISNAVGADPSCDNAGIVNGSCPISGPAICSQGRCVVRDDVEADASPPAASGTLPTCTDLFVGEENGCIAARTVLTCADSTGTQVCDSDNLTSCPGKDAGASCTDYCPHNSFAVFCSGSIPAGCDILFVGPAGGNSGCCVCEH